MTLAHENGTIAAGEGSGATGKDLVLDLQQVDKAYGTGEARFLALNKLDLAVRRGEYVGIVGASGSGKSTLLNILGCLDRPSGGKYRLDGVDVSKLGDDSLSALRNRSIGFVFQSFHLIPELSVRENVELPLFYAKVKRRVRHQRAGELLDSVGLAHRIDYLPTKLSGGERQRAAIARALIGEPALLLADEPTGNLDSENGVEVMKLFDALHEQGRTIVVVTHNLEIARELPRVVELRDGQTVDAIGHS